MAWQTFATKTSPTAMSTLDTQSSNLSAMGIVDCTASGTNVITLTPVLSGYTGPAYANNVKYGFLAANTTTGVLTLKVGSLAALKVYKYDGTTQLTTGDVVAARYYVVAYNAALDSAAGGWIVISVLAETSLSAASQAEQETGTSTTTYVSPGRQQFHVSAAKGWASYGVTANILASYNVSSITDLAAGHSGVNWATDFSSANYAAVAMVQTGTALSTIQQLSERTAAYCNFYSQDITNSPVDPSSWACVAFGDQA